MAYKLGSKTRKGSYSAFEAKGLISPIHQEEEKRYNLAESGEKDSYTLDQIGDVKKARQAAARRYNETPEGKVAFEAMNNSVIKEGSKPDIRGNYKSWDAAQQRPSGTLTTTMKDSKANKAAYHSGLDAALLTDDLYKRDKEIIKRGVVGDAVTQNPDVL
jgi:hypothetical protein